mmetsp:Transcript_33700/g.66592  ORF Transcript_33700/g.66592 Transcript_33700/m.66592 type:complete len:80 (+) Transcript_33700:332-571(+)
MRSYRVKPYDKVLPRRTREAGGAVRRVAGVLPGVDAVCGSGKKKVDGYPTSLLGNGKTVGGEAPLGEIALKNGFRGEFD